MDMKESITLFRGKLYLTEHGYEPEVPEVDAHGIVWNPIWKDQIISEFKADTPVSGLPVHLRVALGNPAALCTLMSYIELSESRQYEVLAKGVDNAALDKLLELVRSRQNSEA